MFDKINYLLSIKCVENYLGATPRKRPIGDTTEKDNSFYEVYAESIRKEYSQKSKPK